MSFSKKIVFFTEMGFKGYTPRTHKNMRTEFAWFTSLNAYHCPINEIETLEEDFDLGIVIIPKNVKPFLHLDIPDLMSSKCKRVGFMQEGPSWYFQDLPINESLWFFNIMSQVDFVLAHNDVDRDYYSALLGKPSFINPTLMIEDLISDLPKEDRKGTIIGGNFVRWYGGFNSFMVGTLFDEPIFAPRMGRMQPEELELEDLNHLPYLEWIDWIKELNKFKYAVHLNPNSIGGTFSLNCAYLGIPCIGNIDSNTQRLCFPELSVLPDDLLGAKIIAARLSADKEFYERVSKDAKIFYKKYFSEQTYLETWNKIIQEIC